MLKRVYLDNFRTFVNFEWTPERLAVLIGDNGAGKSALLEALLAVQSLILGDASSIEAFPASSRTRWDTRTQQTVELEIEGNSGLYTYRLTVEHHAQQPGNNRITEERLSHDGIPLLEFVGGELQLRRDDGSAGPKLKAKWTRSGVGAVEPGPENTKLTWFQQWLQKVWILRPDARAMRARVERDAADSSGERDGGLDTDMKNLGAWYLRALRQRPKSVFRAAEALSSVLPGFSELHERDGWIHARFEHAGKTTSFRLDELSDGQRALLSLYLLRHVVMEPGSTVAIDEPNNHVSLRELQPWLAEVLELASRSDGPQVWLISHHPEVLNLLARERGWLFRRDVLAPTRVGRFHPAEGLDAAETLARGWEDG